MFRWLRKVWKRIFSRAKAAPMPEPVKPDESNKMEEEAAANLRAAQPPAKPRPKLEADGAKLDFVKRSARHEAAHIVVGEAIGEYAEWVNIMGMPGVDR